MKALITGISGFVGSYLCDRLSEAGYEIVGISRKKDWSSNNSPNVTYISCDINNAELIRKIIAEYRPTEIYHLAGPAFVPDSMNMPLLAYHSVVNGTLNLFEVVRKLELDARILYVGSGDVYGDVGGQQITEDFLLQPSNPYAGSKACADIISEQYVKTYGLNIIRARPFNHSGPGQSEHFVCSNFAKQIAMMGYSDNRKLIVGNIEVERDFLDVRDVVDAYLLLMKLGVNGKAYNVCSGIPHSIKQFIQWIMIHSGINDIEIVVDENKLRKNDIPIRVGDNAVIRDDTGWMPKIELESTMKELLYYWRERM